MILKCRVDKVYDDKVEATWFVGPDEEHLQNAGRLVFKTGEYQAVGAALLLGADQMSEDYSRLKVISEDALFRAFHRIGLNENKIQAPPPNKEPQ